jgi:hypothetical protein
MGFEIEKPGPHERFKNMIWTCYEGEDQKLKLAIIL